MVHNHVREVAVNKSVLRARDVKRKFTRSAIAHFEEHVGTDIPSMQVHDPADVLRLRLERFPDIATERLGAIATGLMIHVDNPGENPLIVSFIER